MVSSRILWVFGALLFSAPALSEFKPDVSAMVKDLETMTRGGNRITIVLWLPTEFWRASLEAGGKISPDEIERFLKELDRYVVVAVADGQEGIAGAVTFAEPELLKSAVTIENTRGTQLSSLPDAEISAGVRNLTQMMRPVFANMLGSLGQHLALVIFAGADKNAQRTVEPSKEGTFAVHVGTVALHYRLPLASLLAPVVDEKTGESFPGNYHFNPFTGNKLSPAPPGVAKPPAAPPAPADTSPAKSN